MAFRNAFNKAVSICTLVGFLGIYACTRKPEEESIPEKETPKEIVSEPEEPIEEKLSPKEMLYKELVYMDYSSIDFEVPKEKIIWPNYFYVNEPRIKNSGKLEEIIYNEAIRLGYSKEKLNTLSIKDVIDLSIEIVCNLLEPYDVDWDKEFLIKYGEYLPIEEYLGIGLGDCDKYADALKAVFDIIDKDNPNTDLIFLFSGRTGGYVIPHRWNVICFKTDDKLVITHIDPTFYDVYGDLEAEIGYHFPNNHLELEARFLDDIWLFEDSYILFDRLYSEYLEKEKEEPYSYDLYSDPYCFDCSWKDVQASVLREMAYLSYQLENKEKMDKTREMYCQLYSDDELAKSPHYDTILYYSYGVEKETGDISKANEFKEELILKCPNSYWLDEF